MTSLDSILKKQRHYFANKGQSSQGYGFSTSHVWMWELDYKESWVPKNRCFWTVVLEKTLGSPLDCKEIQPVHPEGSQSWIFIWKNWCWSWNSNTLTTWCEELTHLKRPWCWERLKAGEEGADRGWDGWMVSLTQWTCVCCVLVVQSCVTFCDPVDYSPPGFSVHGILQVRILKWVAISFSMGSSQPRDRTWVSCLAGRCFILWATSGHEFG